MKIVVVSESNAASSNIGNALRKRNKKIPARFFEIKDSVLDLDKYENQFRDLQPELIIVASSHKSEAGVPMLNCHTTGNWTDDTSHGGKPRTLSIAPALYMRAGILEFLRLKKDNPALKDYEVGLEVTHHSPTIPFPVIFVEVGSTEKQWNDPEACEAAAAVIYRLLDEPEDVPVAVGFGGGHYCPQFNKVLTDAAIGHICPKYAVDAVDESTILQAFENTVPEPEIALIDWKGLTGEQKAKITGILDKNQIEWEKF